MISKSHQSFSITLWECFNVITRYHVDGFKCPSLDTTSSIVVALAMKSIINLRSRCHVYHYFINPVSVPTPKDQKPAAPNKVPAQTVTSSRVKGAGRASAKRVLATRTLHRPRQMTSAKETRGMRGNAGPNRSGIDAKTNRVAAAGAQVSGESAACDGLVRAEKHFDTLSNDAKTAKPRREDAAEHRKEEEKIINKNIVDCCLKIRELKTKLSTLSSAPSREIEHAKKQFLGAVEGSFSSEFIFEPKDSSTDEMQSSFRKSVKSKLIDGRST